MSAAPVRKSAHGRTSVFVNVGDETRVQCVRTSSAAMKRVDGATYHNLHETASRVAEICCWHCCEPIAPGEPRYAIPKAYSAQENMYSVYGHFDSLPCCKAFILEQCNFDRGHQTNIFSRMVRDVYKCNESIVEAPPRLSLRRFGGPFDIRECLQSPRVARILQPPFVSYCMFAEEQPQTSSTVVSEAAMIDDSSVAMVDDDVFSEPPPVALYQSFLARTPRSGDTTGAVSPKRKRRLKADAEPSQTDGTTRGSTLRRFCKPSSESNVPK